MQSLSCQLLDNENFVRDGCKGKLDKCTVYIVQEIFLLPFWQTEAALTWDKCLTTFLHTSNETCEGKFVKENLLTVQARLK